MDSKEVKAQCTKLYEEIYVLNESIADLEMGSCHCSEPGECTHD